MGKAGIKDSGNTTSCADARDARLISEMHLSVVARASRKTGETLFYNFAVSIAYSRGFIEPRSISSAVSQDSIK